MTSRRGTSNSNQRPNSRARLRLKQHCLDRDGDGVSVLCAGECGTKVTLVTGTLDRYPIAGYDGGTYRQNNCRLMCLQCNARDGVLSMHKRKGHKIKEKP